MKIKSLAEKISDMLRSKKIRVNRKIVLSYASVFLIVILLLSATASWFTTNDLGEVNTDSFTMETVTGLRVNDGEDLKNHIILENIRLEEASSVDGRNMFFPTTGTLTSKTSEMKFREGNVGDKNYNYCYKDFVLKGDSGITYVYMKNYSVKVNRIEDGKTVQEIFDGSTKINYENGIPVSQESHEECPIRMAFITDSCEKPTMIDPTALVQQYAKKYNAVNMIDENGVALTAQSVGDAFSDYYFATGKPIFTLNGTEPLAVTMLVWLEGTSEACDQYAGQDISIDIELESNWSDMDYVKFVDDTLPDDEGVSGGDHWIGSDDVCIIMTYKDINAEDHMKSIVMQQTPGNQYEWFAPIPKNIITDISFYRYSLTNETIYNSWHTREDVYNQLSDKAKGWVYQIMGTGYLQEYRTTDGSANGTIEHTYTARRGNGHGYVEEGDDYIQMKRLSPCIGYWGTPGGSTPSTTPTGAIQPTTGPSLGDDVLISYISVGKLATWVQGNLNNKGYELYVEFSDGSLAKMTRVNSDYYKSEQVPAKLGTTVKYFTLMSAYDVQQLPLEAPQLITGNSGMSFEMQESGMIKRTS